MTVATERPSRQYDDLLVKDIKFLISGLDENIYNIIKDYQPLDQVEYILIDSRNYHYQIMLHDSGKVELMRQQYLSDSRLGEPYEVEIVNIPQFVCCLLG
ncbi:hypothetical protein [Okeania sp. SIO1I7]|uniref:hypothetical protein n=1 Tax=Okeania sp. SIO1I7 TaxID=2607772 RepID=UPI0013FA734F|nr:hypothetical protein [Okeania sp. SIO1I7]NET27035.1 hypothetical protein [Okeania sp. SIO1I7]